MIWETPFNHEVFWPHVDGDIASNVELFSWPSEKRYEKMVLILTISQIPFNSA
tara:strand:- start:791 stop:949 length:159 start_codon:yes stop_codon:yes gene_type:complete